jgi:GT2 family glycosyltransferase
MNKDTSVISLCIPTYKRTHLLRLLVEDMAAQSRLPDVVIIVDGNPSSGEVQTMLAEIPLRGGWRVKYIPSNHGNLSYQRYLGWRAAADLETDVLIYFDDDQRIYQRDVLEWLTRPLLVEDSDVVGVGCFSHVPEKGHDPAMNHLMTKKQAPWLARFFGSHAALGLKPGQLSPTGHRIALVDTGQDYVDTDWLYGRVMAYRMSAIFGGVFSENLFALDHIRCGLGEDTFLSRRVGARGKLLYTFRAVVEHPNADTPKSYPYRPLKYAYAATYSRRFLNDYYRVYDPPTASDRWALVKSFAGSVLLAWSRALSKPNKANLALARGTTLGAIHGLTRPPNARRLTPNIDWWADAEEALAAMQTIT